MQANNFLVVIGIAGAAAVASPLGGYIALRHKPTTFSMSLSLGFASGVLLATICFEMLPQAIEQGGLAIAIGGFAAGFLLVYFFDLFIHHGKLAGPASEQHPAVQRFYQRHRPRGSEVTVLGGGTSVEELIEGLSIGVGAAIKPGLGMLIALAILIDNLSEAFSIGEIIRHEHHQEQSGLARQIFGWTGLIGASVLVAALTGWFFLKGLPGATLGFLFGTAGGGMFYLVVTDLLPEAEERQYQQSAALALGLGFLIIFLLSQLI